MKYDVFTLYCISFHIFRVDKFLHLIYMCIEIVYTFCGLYVTYCCCFCANLGYVIRKESQGTGGNFTEFS